MGFVVNSVGRVSDPHSLSLGQRERWVVGWVGIYADRVGGGGGGFHEIPHCSVRIF